MHSLWHEAHFKVKMYKTHHVRNTINSDVEKLDGAVARSTFANQNIQNLPFLDHFLKLGSGKIAPVVARNTFQSRSTFVNSDIEKINGAVAKSTFANQNI